LGDRAETVIFGDGEQTRDFVYVGDVVSGLLAAAVSPGGGVYNVGTGVATAVSELHWLCAQAAGVEQAPRFEDDRPGDLRKSVIDPSRAAQTLGWRAEKTLAAGLAETWHAVHGQ
jgi:UDP-glucose 4-epimerase